MKQVFLKKSNNTSLTILFAGWGMDENVFKSSIPSSSDFMVCYNYNSLDFNLEILKGYNKINIIGWSMGVWAASVIMEKIKENNYSFNISGTVAINGTITPIDDLCGIPTTIYSGTVDNFSERGLNKFNRRMCGNSEALCEFNQIRPQRELDDLKEELIAIRNMMPLHKVNVEDWKSAIIGENDMIFPKDNQINAWNKSKQTSKTIMEIAHYSRNVLNDIITNY